jgi:predicted RNA-binding protein YlxR (DUF448 family)
VRVVRTPQGLIVIDVTGRMAGRGAYLCRDVACWDLAGRKRALEHALKAPIPTDLVETLAAGPAALATMEATTRVIGARTGLPDANPDLNEGGAHGQE